MSQNMKIKLFTTLSGACPDCNLQLKNLVRHRCRLAAQCPPPASKQTCDACGLSYRWANGFFKPYKNVTLCSNCFFIPEVHEERLAQWAHVASTLRGAICSFCQTPLVDAHGKSLCRWALDHRDPSIKRDSICNLIAQGASTASILQEVDKCRALCYCCHALVTKAETIVRLRGCPSESYEACNALVDVIAWEMLAQR